MASLGAWSLLQTSAGSLKPTQAMTFASPHVGNGDFAKAYNAQLSQVRYENYLDFVPFVPPDIEFLPLLERIPDLGKRIAGAEAWNYAPVGALQYITKDGAIEPDHAGLGAKRIAEILIDMVTAQTGEQIIWQRGPGESEVRGKAQDLCRLRRRTPPSSSPAPPVVVGEVWSQR